MYAFYKLSEEQEQSKANQRPKRVPKKVVCFKYAAARQELRAFDHKRTKKSGKQDSARALHFLPAQREKESQRHEHCIIIKDVAPRTHVAKDQRLVIGIE